jgi:hypothetical protein
MQVLFLQLFTLSLNYNEPILIYVSFAPLFFQDAYSGRSYYNNIKVLETGMEVVQLQ